MVVGGGLAGLSLANKLRGRAIVVEWLDRLGGVSIYDEVPVDGVTGREMVDRILDGLKGAEVRLESSVVKVDGRGATVVSADGFKLIRGRVVCATGFREKTLLELGIYGFRPAGVFYLHTAYELLGMGFSLGDKVAIYGFNHYSLVLADKLRKFSDKVYMIKGSGSLIHKPDDVLRLGLEYIETGVRKVEGTERVEALLTDDGTLRVDTLVIAELAPFNPLRVRECAGNAAMIIEDPKAILRLSEIVVENLQSRDDAINVECNVNFAPRKPRVNRIMLFAPRGAKIRIEDAVLEAEKNYPVVELPRRKHVRVKVM